MSDKFISHISQVTKINNSIVEFCFNSFKKGSTVPFLARYRKDEIGNISETDLRNIKINIDELLELEKRKSYIIDTIEKQGKLTEYIKNDIINCYDKLKIEDIYLPFKKSRVSKADKAIKLGLEKLGNHIFFLKNKQSINETLSTLVPQKFKGTKDDAINGAIDIVSEKLSSHLTIRDIIRENLNRFGKLEAKKKRGFDGDTSKYRDYLDYNEPIDRISGNRILAVFRGTKERILSKKISYDYDRLLSRIIGYLRRDDKNDFYPYFKKALDEAIKKSIVPAVEKEVFNSLFERAEDEALEIYKKNLTALLMSAPAGKQIVFSLDPGYKNGCKSVILGKNGELLDKIILFPFYKNSNSIDKFLNFIKKYSVTLIVIGDGTASKETYKWAKNLVNDNVTVTIASESGASIYSASDRAIKEFPDLDISYRGSISIGRRVQDPLAELVKLDPKSVGVGQYQYDLNEKKLDLRLSEVVESCVNSVGTDLNSTSSDLLNFISGISQKISDNIIKYRTKNGSFKTLNELLKVKGVGAKVFQQCSGFLRIEDGDIFLDSTSLHPETYPIIEKILNKKVTNITESDIKNLTKEKLHNNGIKIENTKFIINELSKKRRDPRDEFKVIEFKDGIDNIEDLTTGMVLNAKINNITTFGFFVDIGIKENGLIHKSQIKNISKYSLGDFLSVEVLEVDIKRKRISLKGI